jgi:hypothetical protein
MREACSRTVTVPLTGTTNLRRPPIARARDRRSVLVQQTKNGSDFLRDLRSVFTKAFSPPRAASSKTAEPREIARG